MSADDRTGGVNEKDTNPTLQALLRIAYEAPEGSNAFRDALRKATAKMRFVCEKGSLNLHYAAIRNRLRHLELITSDLHLALRRGEIIGVQGSTRDHFVKAVLVAKTVNPKVPRIRLEMIPSEGEIKFCEVCREHVGRRKKPVE